MIKTSAPGKISLFGENAVVYGEAAIATAIDRRLYVTACELDDPKIVVESKTTGNSFESSLHGPSTEPLVKIIQTALKKVKLNPAMQRDRPVKVWVSIPVVFKLK